MEADSAGAVDPILAGTRTLRATVARAIRLRVSTIGFPVPGENHDWYDRIATDYQEALGSLGLVGYWILEDRSGDDPWIDGLSVGCPDGVRLEIPDPLEGEKRAAFAVRLVDFFAALTAHRAPPAEIPVQGKRDRK